MMEMFTVIFIFSVEEKIGSPGSNRRNMKVKKGNFKIQKNIEFERKFYLLT